MKLKNLLMTTVFLFSINANANNTPFLTTPIENWVFIQDRVVMSCMRENYKIKSVITEKNQIICFKQDKVHGKELERNIKLFGNKVMIGYMIDSEQWFEMEDRNGDIKVININQDINRGYVEEIFKNLK